MKVRITNFKSIEDAKLSLERVTLIIGPPATGKSNILEGIALACYPARFQRGLIELYRVGDKYRIPSVRRIIQRVNSIQDLFFFGRIGERIRLGIESNGNRAKLEIYFERGELKVNVNGEYSYKMTDIFKVLDRDYVEIGYSIFDSYAFDGRLYGFDRYSIWESMYHRLREHFKPYLSIQIPKTPLDEAAENISNIILQYRDLLPQLNSWICEYGIKLEFKSLANGTIVVFDYDYEVPSYLTSEGCYRLLYYIAAIHSCMDYVKTYSLQNRFILLLEEPETHIYPYSLNPLISKIEEASNILNIIITTHNPLLISRIWDRIRNLKVYYTYRDKLGRTRITPLSITKLAENLVTASELLTLKPDEVIEEYAEKEESTE